MNNPQNSADVRHNDGHGAKTAAIRERAVLALLSERTISNAARKSGVNEKTLRRWLSEDEAFKTDYSRVRRAVFETGMSRVQALVGRAVDTLDELLNVKKHPAVRLGAARTVVELGLHQHDAETIMRKLEELESRLNLKR
jgi:transposase-like protein